MGVNYKSMGYNRDDNANRNVLMLYVVDISK